MKIQGKIIDETGLPFEGVNVVVLDRNYNSTSVGTATNKDGFFSISSVLIDSITTPIKISFAGYKPIIMPVASLIALKNIVQLREFTSVLDPVEVSGKPKKYNNSWYWLLLIPAGYGLYKLLEKSPKKISL